MIKNTPAPASLEELDREIEILQRLIHKAAETQSAWKRWKRNERQRQSDLPFLFKLQLI